MCFEGLPSYRCFIKRDVFGDWAAYSERDTEVFRLEIIYIIILDSKYDYRTEGKYIVF